MTERPLHRLLAAVAVPGYGYPDHLLVWHDHVPADLLGAVTAWAAREGHAFVELWDLGAEKRRGYWLVPRSALEG